MPRLATRRMETVDRVLLFVVSSSLLIFGTSGKGGLLLDELINLILYYTLLNHFWEANQLIFLLVKKWIAYATIRYATIHYAAIYGWIIWISRLLLIESH